MANRGSSIVLSKEAQEKIGSLTSGLTKKIETEHRKAEICAKLKEKRERENKEFQKVNKQQTIRRVRRHHMLAHKGLALLIAFASSPVMRQLFTARTRAEGKEFERFVFYEASRPSGEAWDLNPKEAREERNGRIADGSRDATIYLYPDAVIVSFGSMVAGDMEVIEFPHSDVSRHADLLLEMVSSGCCGQGDAIKALDHKQRVYEWDPATIAAKVLMDCADSKRFERYLSLALKREKRRV